MKDIRKVETDLMNYIKRLTRVRFIRNRRAVQGSGRTFTGINRLPARDCLDRLKNIFSAVLRDIATIGMRDGDDSEYRSRAIEGRSTDGVVAVGSVGLTPNPTPAQPGIDESVNSAPGVGVSPSPLPVMEIDPESSAVYRNNNSVTAPVLVNELRPIDLNRCPQLEYSRDLDIREIADDARNLLVDAINSRQV